MTVDTPTPLAVRAHHAAVRHLGHWTTARRFDVRASRGTAMLELRSPRIERGEIEVRLDLDHAMVKLLVPEGAIIDDGDLRRVGRCGLVDWSGEPAPDGRRIRLVGELRSSEVRINRGGIAIVSAMMTREYLAELWRMLSGGHWTGLADLQDAYREGRWTTLEDPGRVA